MRITHLTYSILFFISSFCYSQQYSIKGVLQDENNDPIAYANAILVDLDDINIVKGVITNESGVFLLENIKKGEYIFKISFLGFEEYTTRVELDRDFDLEIITLKETLQELDGVTVVAKRPTIKRLVDRTVFNVENSTLSNNNVLDVLKHTPGVLVNNGTISVKNTTATVYINDRKVHLSIEEVQQLLEGTPANNIKSIEVITNPPAKYEAEGGAILNIVTSKNIIAGYNGSVFGNYKQGSEYPKYSFGTSHFFKTKKLSTYLNYNISPKREFRHNDEFINFINDDNAIFSSWETDFNRVKKSANQILGLNTDYIIDEKNSIGFTINTFIAPRKGTRTNINSETNVYGINTILDSSFVAENKLVEEKFNFAFTLEYLHKSDKKGENLRVSLHHTNFDSSNFQDANTGYFFSRNDTSFRNNRFQNFSSQKIKIFTGQLDYELPINDSEHFDAGVKVSFIDSESRLRQDVFNIGVKNEDIENSDTFLYDELNYAVYLSYSKSWEQWSLKTGVRSEYTNIKGNSLSLEKRSSNNYLNLFPSIHLTRKINDSHRVSLIYSKGIQRPKYNRLNPFRYYLNDNAFKKGDPDLRFQIDSFYTLEYILNDDYVFSFYYNHEKTPVREFVYQDNMAKEIQYLYANINKSDYYGFQFSTYKTIFRNWGVSILFDVNYFQDQIIVLNSIDKKLLALKKWISYSQLSNYFTLLKDKSLSMDISLMYYSPFIDGPSTFSGVSSLDISFRKTFWNNRASLTLGVVDLLNTRSYNQTTRYDNQDVYTKSSLETRLFTFGFNYKFGNFRLNNNKRKIDSNERNRLKTESVLN